MSSSTNCWALRFARCYGSRAAPCCSPAMEPRGRRLCQRSTEIDTLIRTSAQDQWATAQTAAPNWESKMKHRSASAVIVGVDGSQAAANAVRWAIDEAMSRGVPLGIVHVASIEERPADDVHSVIDHAETSLRAATA